MNPPLDSSAFTWRDATYRDRRHLQHFKCTDAPSVLLPSKDQSQVAQTRPWETELQDGINAYRPPKNRRIERLGFHDGTLATVAIAHEREAGRRYYWACVAVAAVWRGTGLADLMMVDLRDQILARCTGTDSVNIDALIHFENTASKNLAKRHGLEFVAIDKEDRELEKWQGTLPPRHK